MVNKFIHSEGFGILLAYLKTAMMTTSKPTIFYGYYGFRFGLMVASEQFFFFNGLRM